MDGDDGDGGSSASNSALDRLEARLVPDSTRRLARHACKFFHRFWPEVRAAGRAVRPEPVWALC